MFFPFHVFLCNPFFSIDCGRMQDIELMHMRYALESTILALGTMERTTSDERTNLYHMALCHLKDLSNHLEAIKNIPRKVECGLPLTKLFFLFSTLVFSFG